MKTLRVIKEPIHDYIGISDLESVLINDPLFLRLQYISQNGLAYLTYPSNRTSRFIHSLGTMHLGGEMTVAIINSADRELRDKFYDSFQAVMKDAAANVYVKIDQLEKLISNKKDVLYMHQGFNPGDPKDVPAITLFQSMRIACVMHDLGHPPFSHSTEAVLQSKLNSLRYESATSSYKKFGELLTRVRRAEQGALHEKIGTELVYYVFSSVKGDLQDFGRFCFWIANRILTPDRAKDDPGGVLKCLHSIVSGDAVDADRCDYVLRDGYASSFEFGEYDLTRILHNLRLTTNSFGHFEIASTTTAVSALESFFLERYRIWRWIVFHPNVVRAELALSRALNILLEIAFADSPSSSEESAIRAVLDTCGFNKLWISFDGQVRYREYVFCDESWLLYQFRAIQETVRAKEWLPRRIAILIACLDFVLDRKKSSSCFVALWKRAEEYEAFARAVESNSSIHFEKLEKAGLARGSGSLTEWLNSLIVRVLAKDLENGEVECLRRLEDGLQSGLRKLGFEGALLSTVLKFHPYKECSLIDNTGKRVPLSSLSRVVSNLGPTWNGDIQFRCYWVGLERNGNIVKTDNSGKVPGRDDLAKCFLDTLLDEKEWANLRVLLGAKEK